VIELIKLFFISPFAAFYNGVKRINRPYVRLFLILFFGFFGATMIFPQGTDGFRHGLNIQNHYFGLSVGDFFNELFLLFQFIPSSGTNDDPYLHILSYLAGFFNSSRVLYLLASLVYGYFYINSLYYVRSLIKNKFNFYITFLFLSLIFIKGFEGINSIRNWTGQWCLFYVVIKYIVTKDKKTLFLLLLPPFIHFGYLFISIPVIISIFYSRYRKVFLIIYFVSFAFSSLNLGDYVLKYTGAGLFKHKTEVYMQDVEEIKMKRNDFEARASIHKLYAYDAFRFYIQFVFIFMLLFFKNKSLVKFLENKSFFILSSSALLLLSFSNIATLIPSLSKRLYMNANVYIITFLLLMYAITLEYNTKSKLRFEFLIKLGLPVYLFFFFMQLSYIAEFANVATILPLPIGIFFLNDDITLKILAKETLDFIF
jgi:hypothetical protein